MRLFLGTFLGAANQDFYGRLVGDLTQSHGNVLRAIPRESAHLTFVFCADTGTRGAHALLDALRQVAARHHAIDVRLGAPHVITAGPIPRLVVGEVVSGGDAIRRLTADLVQRCQDAFPDLEWRPSREPHLTLARFRKQARRSDGEAIVRALGGAASAPVTRDDRIGSVQAIESTLTPRGPAYTVVGEVPLS